MIQPRYFCIDCEFETYDADDLTENRCIGCYDNFVDAERDRRQSGWNPFDYD